MSTITKERFNEILREEIVREREEQKALNEFFDLEGLKNSAIEMSSNVFAGAGKQKIADFILDKIVGIKNDNARLMLSEIIEQIEFNDLKMIIRGGTGSCSLATKIFYKAMCEVLGVKIHEKLVYELKNFDGIGPIATWLGKEGALNALSNRLTSEIISDLLSSEEHVVGAWMYENIYPPLEIKICDALETLESASWIDIISGDAYRQVTNVNDDSGNSDITGLNS